eukprot:TRINITY_DN16213_c0_g2_i1.p1 TRINITY_DN16213_c0_g2~~TRINITY_DN16213_c0_g2_i1.p1  ORF type:complete len:342 (-),score=31.29 TRINITY_DN16213_c0_g2_i1:55-1080(-)
MDSVMLGYLCAFIAVLCFGSNFIVVAKYDAGDGMFFQFVLCLGIWCVGLVVFLLRDQPKFYPFALLGGAIWCSGNCCTIFVINRIGLGPGLVTWGTMSLLIGWLTGFFGLFGLPNERDCLEMPWLNVVGFCISCCALVASTFIKKGIVQIDEGARGLQLHDSALNTPGSSDRTTSAVEVPASDRLMGILAALFAGSCYGLNFHPSSWIQDHVNGASQDGLDYVFNQFCGILTASTFYMLIYCVVKNNKPEINPEVVLPGFLSGVIWAIAQTCWFVANANLGYSAAFPIVLIGPGFVGSLWSVFLFKDISGRRNYIFIGVYFAFAVVACLCIVVSRKSGQCP